MEKKYAKLDEVVKRLEQDTKQICREDDDIEDGDLVGRFIITVG